MYLNCHTAFSFKYGTLMPAELLEQAERIGARKIAITEINNTASYMELLRLRDLRHRAVMEKDGDPSTVPDIAVGVEFRRDHQLLYIALARNNEGFEEINRFLSYHNRERKELPIRPSAFSADVFIIRPWKKDFADPLRSNEFVGVRKSDMPFFLLDQPPESLAGKCVILHPVTFGPPVRRPHGKSDRREYNTHRLLRAIDTNTLLSKLPPHAQACEDEHFHPEAELLKPFASYPLLIGNTLRLLDQCSIELALGEDKNKKFFSNSAEDDVRLLRTEAEKGFNSIYGQGNASVWERIERELSIIERKRFTAYYLIAYDLIRFARLRGYDFVGRGSGANSTVAYCLGITNVDPIELNLYFERFLNEERSSPPDFDIDFSWDNRDAIYDYLFQKYGPDHICLLGTHVTFQWRSILRELGKVFGLPKEELDAFVESPERYRNRDHISSLVYNYASYIVEKGLPSHMSIHAGGVLITEKPIYAYTATELPAKGYPVSHFEMHNAEDFGIFKFDILSQRGLGHIKETVKLVKRNKSIDVDIRQFKKFKEDEDVKALLRESRAMGCFYVESPAMRMLLGKLRCDDYLTLVAASSIIRPGVASSGMMRAYVERFHAIAAGKKYEAIHPKIDELMRETYGVMVYQEDVIKVAHEFAGLTLTEADVLRRGMSGKYRSREEFQHVKERFMNNCRERGYPEEVIQRVWFEIESFSGYSFAKGHSASYAVESYQSLFLKAHFPLEFMVGVINNFGGFYKTEFYFHEARRNGAVINAPCANQGEYLTTIDGEQIFVGFIHIKGLDATIGRGIEKSRAHHGAFKSLHDFLQRMEIGLEQARLLIRVGAFRFTGLSKQHLLWEAMLFFGHAKSQRTGSLLFDTAPKEFPLPPLERGIMDDAFDELELLGFPLQDPFRLLASPKTGSCTAARLSAAVGAAVKIAGYLVTVKDTWTKSGARMHFGTFLDAEGDVFDTVHFPGIAQQFPFRGRGFYNICGKVVEDFGIVMIEVSAMEKLPMIDKRADEAMQERAAASEPALEKAAAEYHQADGHNIFNGHTHFPGRLAEGA